MAGQQRLDLELRGLYTAPNNLSGVPQGALEVADNVVIPYKSLIESRRGQTQYGEPLPVGSGQVNKLFNYSSSLIANYDNKMAYDAGDGDWMPYSGTYNPPAAQYKMRSLEALKNFYFTTDSGIKKLDALTGTPRDAGVVRALGGTATLVGSSGFLLDDSAVAYRMIWSYKDANGNLIQGAPSQRLVVPNDSGGGRDVELTYLIPDTITTEYFYGIYRSVGTATANDEPTDELQLVIQANPTQAEITAKSFTVTDSTPYSLMRATLYTSPSQEGIANANAQPPFAADMDVFKTCAFYANVRSKQSVSLALIGVGEDSNAFGYYLSATAIQTVDSPIITGLADTTNIRVGMRAWGSNIPPGTLVKQIDGPNQVTLSDSCTASTNPFVVEFRDVITIAGVPYYAASYSDPVNSAFEVETGSTPGVNIAVTAENLIELVNTLPANTTIYGYYISGVEDLPGQMLFEERGIGGAEFQITSTAGQSFSPRLPRNALIYNIGVGDPTEVTSNQHGLTDGDVIRITNTNSTPTIDGDRAITYFDPNKFFVDVDVTIAGNFGHWVVKDEIVRSSNEAHQNRVMISKAGQVEAVPVYRFFDIGSANFPIERVIALRDGIFFFKPDGVYRLSGETFESFVVTLLDNTVVLKAPQSAVPFNNQVFCMTTQGICAVSDSGVRLMSVAIENTLLEISSDQYPYFNDASFGVAYESSRSYMFYTVTEKEDQWATQAFVYNSLTDSWTRWVMERTCGIVSTAVDKLFMAEPESGQVMIERKNFTNEDFADKQYDVVIENIDDETTITLADVSQVFSGMTLVQNDVSRLILSVDEDNDQITVSDTRNLDDGAATVYEPIANAIQWAPIDMKNPGILKQVSELSLFFKNAAFQTITGSFTSNLSLDNAVVPLVNQNYQGAWGQFSWGRQPWGGPLGGQSVIRTYVPREKQRNSWLILKLETAEAFTGFSLQGVSFIFNLMSSWIK